MEIKAGELDRRIIIEQETITRDAFGAEVIVWSTLATIWAGIKYLGASETAEANQVVSLNTTSFMIRYRDDITARMRVYYNSKYFTINYITYIGRLDGMYLHCDLRDHE